MVAINPCPMLDAALPQPVLTWRGQRYADGRRGATVTCGQGHPASLTLHLIADDGTVIPSLVCPAAGCPWHEHVRLVGWTR